MDLLDLISEEERAKMEGRSQRSLQRERALRIGPPFIKIGRTIYYRREALREHYLALEQNQVRAPKPAGRAA